MGPVDISDGMTILSVVSKQMKDIPSSSTLPEESSLRSRGHADRAITILPTHESL